MCRAALGGEPAQDKSLSFVLLHARVKQLERTLAESKRKEAREAQDLEAVVQQAEENLQLVTVSASLARLPLGSAALAPLLSQG